MSRYAKVVLDTGPLFSALALEFIKHFPAMRNLVTQKYKLPSYLGDPTAEAAFVVLISDIRQLMITSHVVGELRNRYRIPSEIHGEFWKCAMTFFAEKQVDERLITLLQMYNNEPMNAVVMVAGPIDAGLITLAQSERCILLTDDHRLMAWMDRSPDIELVQNVLEGQIPGHTH